MLRPIYLKSTLEWSVDRLEMVLSEDSLWANVSNIGIPQKINVEPTVRFKSQTYYNDTSKWTKLSATFQPTESANYLYIGQFSNDSSINISPIGTIYSNNKIAYYLIDEVKLYKASDTIVHNVPPEMPNVFSPNQDGVNDVYAIKNLPENSTLEIFNRWGSPVFTATPYQNNWPGNGPDGSPLAEGVYFAILSYRDKNGKLQQAKQTVHLVR